MEEGGGRTLAPGAEGGKEGEKGSHRIGVMKRLRAACIDGSRGLEPHDDVTSHFPRGLLFFFFFCSPLLLHFPFQCLDFCFKGESDVS